MDERSFVDKKRADWDRLAELIVKAGRFNGVRSLSREEVKELGPLYRRASSDLAYARAHATSSDLVLHLNGLVGRAHALLFEAEKSKSPVQSVVHFYLLEFPALLQKHARYFLAAIAVSVLGGLLGYWLVIHDENKINIFIPPGELRESVKSWKEGTVAHEGSPEFAGMLMTHNQTIGLIAFAGGVVAGIPTASSMLYNGAMVGAMAALMTRVHQHHTFWPGILPHGIAELTAIFICGAAGFLIGISLLFPGRYRRSDAFLKGGLDAIRLVLGSIPLFIFAGIVEGMFSHLPIRPAIRYLFASVNGVLWYLYLFFPRRLPETVPGSSLARNLPAA
jgi:uncharacterized membrane protein SpoIIM required for sporulation